MSFRFGQFRRNQIDSFLTSLDYRLEEEQTKSTISTATIFIDEVISIPDMLKPTEPDSANIKSYYLSYRIYKKSTPQEIIIKLINTNKQVDNTQTLKTITVEAGRETEYLTYEMIISPNNNYDQIKFELQRELEDYNTKNSDGTYGRSCKIEVVALDEIYNVIDYLSTITGTSTLLQIGVQSAPGLLMCINGEEIRVGRSGLYEILNGYKITFIGFMVEPDDNKHFILDYQY